MDKGRFSGRFGPRRPPWAAARPTLKTVHCTVFRALRPLRITIEGLRPFDASQGFFDNMKSRVLRGSFYFAFSDPSSIPDRPPAAIPISTSVR